MRKLVAGMKVSLDMKFQGPNDYADWVHGWSADYDITPEIDACLLGGAMYRGYEGYWTAIRNAPTEPSPMTGTVPTERELLRSQAVPTLPHYALSRETSETAWDNTRFLHRFDDIAKLKDQPGKAIYLMGGGQMVRSLMDLGLLDELRLITYPIIAGGPHDLFGADEARHSLNLIAVRDLPGGLVRSDYRIVSSRGLVVAE